MVVDKAGYRLNVGIILVNDKEELFWGRRVGHDAWQFPQGGIVKGESAIQAMYRELKEEVGIDPNDVKVIGSTRRWLRYKLPKQYIRQGTRPLIIGQKQKWFVMRLVSHSQKIRLDLSESPEFDSWCWIKNGHPQEHVIFFKRQVYRQALKELMPLLKRKNEKKKAEPKPESKNT